MKLKTTISILSLFVSHWSFSQTYTGKISDSKNIPIAYADVVAINNNDNTPITGVITDDNGNFELKLKTEQPFYLEIRFIGFETQKITPTKTDLGTIFLKEQATELKEVIVQGRKKLIKRKVDRLIFDVASSSKSSVGDAMEVLKVTPSVRVRNDRITMIGKSGMQVMVNDRLVRLSGDALVNYLVSIPSENIKNIEVITAPPAKYDAQGNSGLININLKKAKNDSWSANLWSYYRQRAYPTGSLGGTFMYSKNKLSINSSVSYRNGTRYNQFKNHTYFSDAIWFLEERSKNNLYSTAARIDVNYQLTKNWTMGGQYRYNLFNVDANSQPIMQVSDNTTSQIIRTLQSVKGEGRSYTMNSFNYNNEFKFNKKKITFDIDYFDFKDTQLSNYNGKQTTISGEQFYKGTNDNKQNITNFSTRVDVHFPTDFAKLNFGGKISISKSLNNLGYFNSGLVNQPIQAMLLNKNDFEYDEDIQALYFSVSKNFGEKLSAKAGLRMEDTQTKSISNNLNFNVKDSYTKWFTTLYLSYDFSENSNFSLNYSKRIQRPSFLELNPNERYSSPFELIEGNAFLKPAFIDNLEFSNTYKNLETKLYYSYEKGMYSQIPISDNSSNITTYTNQNYIDRQRYGISESYTFNHFKWWSSTNSVDFNYSISTFNLTTPHEDKKGYNTSFSTDNDFVLNKTKTLKAGVNFWYDFPSVDGIFENKSASSLSFSLQYYMLDKNLRLTFRANDVFKGSRERSEAVINGVLQKANYYYDSQYFQLSVSYRFGNKKIRTKRNRVGNSEERRRTN